MLLSFTKLHSESYKSSKSLSKTGFPISSNIVSPVSFTILYFKGVSFLVKLYPILFKLEINILYVSSVGDVFFWIINRYVFTPVPLRLNVFSGSDIDAINLFFKIKSRISLHVLFPFPT